MKSRTALLSISIFALFVSAPAAMARPLHAPADAAVVAKHRTANLERTGYNSADVGALAATSVAACGERFAMQSPGYDGCLQQLPASALIGH